MAIKIQGTTVINDDRTITNLASALAVSQGGTGVSLTPENGEILIGNGTGYTKTTISAGSNVVINNQSGSITISSIPGGEAFSAF
jgi:hypothetical protein